MSVGASANANANANASVAVAVGVSVSAGTISGWLAILWRSIGLPMVHASIDGWHQLWVCCCRRARILSDRSPIE